MPTLREYRRAIARELWPGFHHGTTDDTSTAALLIDDTFPVKSSIDNPELYREKYLLLPNKAAADRLRLIDTYTPSGGQIKPDLAWSSLGGGEEYEIHSNLIRPDTDLVDLINEGLKRCMLVDEFSFSPGSDVAIRHSLAEVAPWLTDPEWVLQVGVLPSGYTDRSRYRPSRVFGHVEQDVDELFLCCGPFNTTDTIYVVAIKPAYYHCRATGGQWGSQSGLALDTDEAKPSVRWVTFATLVEVWRLYGTLLEAEAAKRVVRDQATAAALFSNEAALNFRPPARTFLKLRRWGPTP